MHAKVVKYAKNWVPGNPPPQLGTFKVERYTVGSDLAVIIMVTGGRSGGRGLLSRKIAKLSIGSKQMGQNWWVVKGVTPLTPNCSSPPPLIMVTFIFASFSFLFCFVFRGRGKCRKLSFLHWPYLKTYGFLEWVYVRLVYFLWKKYSLVFFSKTNKLENMGLPVSPILKSIEGGNYCFWLHIQNINARCCSILLLLLLLL